MSKVNLKIQFQRFAPLGIIAIAALLRLVNLGYPHVLVFDETYYVKDAFALLNHGVETNWNSGADDSFANGKPTGLGDAPSFVVHPPLGKWLISLGMLVFGAGNAFGWRIVVALLGIAAVWLSMKCSELLFKSKTWSIVVGLLFAIDGVGIVLSRTALLDQILGFFALLAFYFLLKDLDQRSGFRWNLVWMGIALGAATSVKWSGLYFLVVFVLYRILILSQLNYKVHRDLEKVTEAKLARKLWIMPSLKSSVASTFLVTIPAVAVYLSSWAGWFASDKGYDRNWAKTHPGSGIETRIPDAFRSLIKYHQEIYNFHANLHSQHDYASNPLTWPFMLRPTSFYWEEGAKSCFLDASGSHCVSAITALGNPLIWWGAFIASSVLIGSWFRTRDKLTSLILVGIIAGYVPWLFLMNRTVFEFYVISFLPWVIFILVFGLKTWLENSANPKRAKAMIITVIGLMALVSVYFLPIWTGLWISYDFWRWHMWLPSWI